MYKDGGNKKIMDNDRTVGVVYESDDYDSFKHLIGNRSVDNARIKNIMDSVDAVGWVKSPIIVNEKKEIIDGQGRLEVLRAKGLPVQYVVAYGAGVKECRYMNIGQLNWKSIDYVRSYAELGNTNYMLLLDLLEKFPQFTVEQVVCISGNIITTHGFASKTLKIGSFVMDEKDYVAVSSALNTVLDFKPYLDKVPGSSRVKYSSIAWIAKNTSANIKRLLDRISKKYPQMSPVVDVRSDIFLAELSEIYNKNLSAQKCIYFDTEYKRFIKEKKSTQKGADSV